MTRFLARGMTLPWAWCDHCGGARALNSSFADKLSYPHYGSYPNWVYLGVS